MWLHRIRNLPKPLRLGTDIGWRRLNRRQFKNLWWIFGWIFQQNFCFSQRKWGTVFNQKIRNSKMHGRLYRLSWCRWFAWQGLYQNPLRKHWAFFVSRFRLFRICSIRQRHKKRIGNNRFKSSAMLQKSWWKKICVPYDCKRSDAGFIVVKTIQKRYYYE